MKRLFVVTALAVLLLPAAGRASILFTASLDSSQEVQDPPVVSTATGSGSVLLDYGGTFITVSLSFSGLIGGPAAAAHIHGPAGVGANAPILFDLSPPALTSGSVGPVNFAITPEQVEQLKDGLFYFNVHNDTFRAGEIRGQILPAPTVPEPGTLALVAAGALTLLPYGWRRARRNS